MKQLKVIIFILSILPASSIFASTNISTINSDADWFQNGSPYIIQTKVVIPKGVTLHVNSGVQVIFQGASALEVDGTLIVEGSAAAPAVFNMIEGGLQSELFINGGEANITNAKIESGVFLAKDAKLTMEGTEVTKGSGVYLQGSTTARLKNNKIYGNATGVVLDGQVIATLTFNTLVQNTYGLVLKGYSDLVFTNNSVHDNQREVVNNTPAVKLGGNYWGSESAESVQPRIQGSVSLAPLRSLKDILRVYVRTQLPVITGKMSAALAAKEKREEKEQALALKNFKKEQAAASRPAAAPAAEAPVAEASVEKAAPAEQAAPAVEEAPAEVETAGHASKIITVKSLPPAPHRLKPLANLPPAQEPGATQDISISAPVAESQPAGSLNPPAVPETPAAPAASTGAAVPAVPDVDLMPPPGLESASPASSTAETVPPPPGSSSNSTSPAASVPPPPDAVSIAPPDLGSSTMPPSVVNAPAPPAVNGAEAIAPPPDLAEQMTPSASGAPMVPPPPASANNTPAAVQAPPIPVNVTPTADQQNAVKKLDSVSGDIDGMQAPPLDLGPDLSNPSAFDDMSGVGKSTTKDTGAKNAPASSGLAIPALKDSDVTPPKDLDLPPIDDLGNVNLDSRNK